MFKQRLRAAAAAAPTLKPRSLAVYVFLLAHADTSDVWVGTFDDIGQELRASWSAVARSFRELVACRFVTKVRVVGHGAAWRLLWQDGHSSYGKNAMAFPPTPPLSYSDSVGITKPPPPPPSEPTDGGGGEREKSSRTEPGPAPNLPGRVRHGNNDIENTCYVKLVNRSGEQAPHDFAESERLLADLRDPDVRVRLARVASPELIKTARAMVGTMRNVRDPAAMAAHLIQSGAARVELEKQERAKAARAANETERRAAEHRAELERETARAELERDRATIAAATDEDLREAVGVALVSSPAAGALVRFLRFRVTPETPRAELLQMATHAVLRGLVIDRLGAIAQGGPRVIPSETE